MSKSISGGVEIINTLSTKNDGNYPLVMAESVGMKDGANAEDVIKNKLNTNQGTENNGKFMKVGADGNLKPEIVPIPDVSAQINTHDKSPISHNDIRDSVNTLKNDKLDKNQGVNNTGKIITVGDDGNVVTRFPNNVTYNPDTKNLEYGSNDSLPLIDGVKLDTSLTKGGFAADAKITGDKINKIESEATTLKEDIDKLSSDDAIKSNMIDGQISHRQTTFIPYEKIENSAITNSGTQSSVIECDNTQLINLEKYPSAIKVFNIYQGVNWGAVVGKKKDGTFAGWKYSSLPSTFCTKYDNYVEINIDYLRSSGLWESLGFNMSHGSDLRMEYDTEILADKKKLEWLIIPHRFIVDKNGHGDYVTIQDAVNNANNGDEIIVFEGEYEEAVDLGTKALHLHGLNASNTIIWNDTGAYDTPPIEVGHGLIENLTFYSKKDSNKDYSEITRKSYAVHLDQRWGNGTKSVVFKNCVFIGEHTTPIGCGVIDDVNIELYDCIADATTLNNGNAFQIHGSSTGTGNANIILNGCTFKKGSIGNGNGILLSNGGAAYNKGTTITIKANNCYGSFYNNAGDLLILDSSSFGNSDSKLNN